MATQNLTRKGRLNKKRGSRVFTAKLDYADTSVLDVTTSADSYELFVAPSDCYITKAEMLILTANDAATSATADVGIDGGDTLIDGGNLKSAANTKLSGGTNAVVPQLLQTGGTITYTPTYTGALTEGAVQLVIEYIELERCEEGELTVFSTTA